MSQDFLRARKSGLAAKIEKKMEHRYDEEDALGTPERIAEWMNAILEGQHEAFEYTPNKVIPWKNLQWWLHDGIAMCKVINKLLESQGKPTVKFHEPARGSFQCIENIDNFNKGAKEYGLPDYQLFASPDLYEGQKGPFLNAINCLNNLGFAANKKNFQPLYEAVEPPERDSEAWGST